MGSYYSALVATPFCYYKGFRKIALRIMIGDIMTYFIYVNMLIMLLLISTVVLLVCFPNNVMDNAIEEHQKFINELE